MTKYAQVTPVEAKQWHKHGDHPHVTDVPHPHSTNYGPEHGWLGGQVVRPGDWLVGEGDNLRVVRPDVFDKTFKPIP